MVYSNIVVGLYAAGCKAPGALYRCYGNCDSCIGSGFNRRVRQSTRVGARPRLWYSYPCAEYSLRWSPSGRPQCAACRRPTTLSYGGSLYQRYRNDLIPLPGWSVFFVVPLPVFFFRFVPNQSVGRTVGGSSRAEVTKTIEDKIISGSERPKGLGM